MERRFHRFDPRLAQLDECLACPGIQNRHVQAASEPVQRQQCYLRVIEATDVPRTTRENRNREFDVPSVRVRDAERVSFDELLRTFDVVS